MKYILTLSFLFSQLMYSQSELDFSKKIIESLDKWVAFKDTKTENSYLFGFIYLDTSAGLSFNYEGNFTLTDDGNIKTKKLIEKNGRQIVRLKKTNRKGAILSNKIIKELGIKNTPDWLKSYKGDENSEKSLYAYGYLYNDWSLCDKAIPYLAKGAEKYPENKKILTELVFAYNCLHQFEKAELFLKGAKKKYPKDAYINKELIYTLVKSNQIKKAEKAIKKSLKAIPNSKYHAENIHNLLYVYYSKKDVKNFKKWLPEAKKQSKNKPQFLNRINTMEKKLL